MESILRGLNIAQRAAVTSPASILQVLAPPGSGKTKTLTSRVAYLLSHHEYAPWNVICCTFTIKAGREMRERLRGMIGGDLEKKLILGTFHSICRRYLVTYGHLIGIPRNFGIADSDDSLNIIKRVVKRLNLGMDPRVARSKISHRKSRGKHLDDVSQTPKNAEMQELLTIFGEYENALRTSNLLDFDDLLIRCVELLQKYPHCVSNVEALLIDEFQDTNIVQFELMKLLASAKKRITIVGDPDQSIYGFRSAEVANLSRMKDAYPDAVVINLEENYRSCSAILKLAQEVIEQDDERPDKKLKSTHRYGSPPVLRRLPNPFEEASWISTEIKRSVAMTGSLVKHGDFAILLRSAFLSLHIEKALATQGIPYRMVGGRRFFDRVEVRILLDYLRTISYPENNSALLAILNTPKRKVGDSTVKALVKLAEVAKEPLWTVLQRVVKGQLSLEKKLTKPAEQGLRSLIGIIEKGRQSMDSMAPTEVPSKLLQLVVNSLKFQAYLTKEYPEDHQERLENVQELITQASNSTLNYTASEDSLPEIEGLTQERMNSQQEVLSRFLANLVLSTEVEGDDGAEKQRVTISTIHSAKGLEWPVVFVPAVYEGSIPHSRAEDTNEERRLLYVAMTRAKALLYLTLPVTQQRDESESILSQFLLSGKINSMVSHRGPTFDNKLIDDIADVLRRPLPSQEALALGLQSIRNKESTEDNLWPLDGSHKHHQPVTESDYPTFTVPAGQSLQDVLRTSGAYNPRRTYSTLSGSAVTITDHSNIPIETNGGFTTASHHLKLQPQLPEKKPFKILPTSTGSAVGDTNRNKNKIVRTASEQGNINSLFLQTPSNAEEHSTDLSLKCGPRNFLSRHPMKHDTESTVRPALSEAVIPTDLATHRLSNDPTTLSNHRSVLVSVKESKINRSQKRNHYNAFSSSPIHDKHENLTQNPTKGAATLTASKKLETVTVNTSQTALASNTYGSFQLKPSSVLQTTTMSVLKGTSQSQLVQPKDKCTGTSVPSGIQYPKMTATTMSVLKDVQNVGSRNKTLGVRRSMNGWANRKHK